ncbi:hypothetical protein, conserved, partial [Eimeria tenella]
MEPEPKISIFKVSQQQQEEKKQQHQQKQQQQPQRGLLLIGLSDDEEEDTTALLRKLQKAPQQQHAAEEKQQQQQQQQQQGLQKGEKQQHGPQEEQQQAKQQQQQPELQKQAVLSDLELQIQQKEARLRALQRELEKREELLQQQQQRRRRRDAAGLKKQRQRNLSSSSSSSSDSSSKRGSRRKRVKRSASAERRRHSSSRRSSRRSSSSDCSSSECSEGAPDAGSSSYKRQTAQDEEVAAITFLGCGVTAAETARLEAKIRELSTKVGGSAVGQSSSGAVCPRAAGTGGPQAVRAPETAGEWDAICFLVVPSAADPQKLKTQPKFLCALLAEVFIVKEAALDFILRSFRVWPEPHTTMEAKLNKVLEEQEYREGGIPSLVMRQELAEARLFAGHEFYVCGSSKEAQLIRTLVTVGNGTLARKGDNADYVVICDEALPEARALRRRLAHRDEDLVAATHGQKHASLVTPKFLYDCITRWTLTRPSRRNGH